MARRQVYRRDGLPADYTVTSCPVEFLNGTLQWYNRHCASLDVEVNGCYACTVLVKLPRDNSNVTWAWLTASAVERAQAISLTVRRAYKKDITVKLGIVLDYTGQIIHKKTKNHGKINRKRAR